VFESNFFVAPVAHHDPSFGGPNWSRTDDAHDMFADAGAAVTRPAKTIDLRWRRA
jgi:hypothetical protein